MAEVKILVEGKHKMLEDCKLEIGSTVTLIKSDKNVLVDTGSFLDREKLILSLKEEGFLPEEIDIVILSHLHLDHLVNVDLFNKSKIFCKFNGFNNYPGQMHILGKGQLQRSELVDGTQIAKDVSILQTPGHSMDMLSILVETKKGKVAIVGDSIGDESWANLEKQPSPALVQNLEKYNESRKKILEIADYIIPGHGGMFKVKK